MKVLNTLTIDGGVALESLISEPRTSQHRDRQPRNQRPGTRIPDPKTSNPKAETRIRCSQDRGGSACWGSLEWTAPFQGAPPRPCPRTSASLLFSGLEVCDTKICEPQIRALLGTAFARPLPIEERPLLNV